VCHVAQEEAVVIRKGARRLYTALIGVGAGVAVMVSSCLVLTAFKPIDSHATTSMKRAPLLDIEFPMDFQVCQILNSRQRPLAYGIPGIRDNFSDTELRVLAEVAEVYGLDRDQTLLLFAIRRVEDGRPGCEMGCGDEIPNHPAKRCAGDFERSLRLQASYASGTIKNRWDGDIHTFARIYCPRRARWWARNTDMWIGTLGTDRVEEPVISVLTSDIRL
jgi:hypothetical protein